MTIEDARTQYIKGDFQKALALYDRCFEIDSENSVALYGRAACYYALGNFDKARELALLVIERNQQYSPPYLLLANLAIKRKEYADAEQFIDKSLGIEPQLPEQYLTLSYILTETNRLEYAIQILYNAKDKFPKNPDIFEALGETLIRKNRFTSGINKLILALSLAPSAKRFFLTIWRIGYHLRLLIGFLITGILIIGFQLEPRYGLIVILAISTGFVLLGCWNVYLKKMRTGFFQIFVGVLCVLVYLIFKVWIK